MTRIPYFTYTIRLWRDTGAPTEFAKRLRAISSGAMVPRYTTQSYVHEPRREGHLLGIGITETVCLIGHFARLLEQDRAKINYTSNAGFGYVGFDEVPGWWYSPIAGWRQTGAM